MSEKRERYELIYKTLADKNNRLSVCKLCELAQVSRSGYYKWLSTAEDRQKREEQDNKDFERIKEIYAFGVYGKGIRAVHKELLKNGINMNSKKIRRICKKYGLMSPMSGEQPKSI